MISARDQAIDILWAAGGKSISRSLFVAMINDKRNGKQMADMVDVMTKWIELDRKKLIAWVEDTD